MVFYSRYYIHEMLLVFFTFLALAAGWRYCRTGHSGWAITLGAALGLMQCTKETFVLPLAAAAIALALNAFWVRTSGSGRSDAAPRGQPRAPVWKHLGLALAAWFLVVLMVMSSFFTNPQGILDGVRTYAPWLNRAAGNSPHIHPWNFYLERLAFFHVAPGPYWSEGFILLLAAVGIVAVFKRCILAGSSAEFLRVLVFYTLTLAAIYTVIPYKTPWCMLGFLHGLILLSGVGVAVVLDWARPRWIKICLAIALLTGVGHLGAQAWRAGNLLRRSGQPVCLFPDLARYPRPR